MWSVVLVDDLPVFSVLIVRVIEGEAGERTHQGDAHDDHGPEEGGTARQQLVRPDPDEGAQHHTCHGNSEDDTQR